MDIVNILIVLCSLRCVAECGVCWALRCVDPNAQSSPPLWARVGGPFAVVRHYGSAIMQPSMRRPAAQGPTYLAVSTEDNTTTTTV